jgi:hypothetical protein
MYDLVCKRAFLSFTPAQEKTKLLTICEGDDDEEEQEAKKQQLAKQIWFPGGVREANALIGALYEGGASLDLIRAMIRRGPHNSVKEKVAGKGSCYGDATLLDLLLTLKVEPRRSRPTTRPYYFEACRMLINRFEQRVTLACCLRHFDELHQQSPLVLHPHVAALSPFAKILHDLHVIKGAQHVVTRQIISYI